MGTDWIAYEAKQEGIEEGVERERESKITTAIVNMRKANKSDDAIVHSLNTLFEYSEAEIRDCLDKIKE